MKSQERSRNWIWGLTALALSAGAQVAAGMTAKTMEEEPVIVHEDLPDIPPVSMEPDGTLSDQSHTNRGDRIIDFSYAGYQASEKPIPFVKAVVTLDSLPVKELQEGTLAYPQGPDSHARIQAALDQVAAMEPDENGFRGAVFLSKGTFYVNGGLTVGPGVVLRGEGQRGFGTQLIFNNPMQAGILMGGGADRACMMGVEGLNITSNHDTAIPSKPEAAVGANALRIGIHIRNAEQAWVRGCTIQHVSENDVVIEDSRHVTVRTSQSRTPVPGIRDGARDAFSVRDSSRILVYDCSTEAGPLTLVIGDEGAEIPGTPEEAKGLFEQQLTDRIGEKKAYIPLTETLSKASIPMTILFPIPIINGAQQGTPPPEQIAFERADQRSWKTVMSDDGTGDWREQWFLDGEGSTTVTNTPEGMELKALENHMVLWTNESFTGDLKIEYDFTRTDIDGGGVIIIYIQATGRGDKGYEEDITLWNDYREEPDMSKYFRNMHTFHVSYACGYVRGRRYMPDIRKMNTFTELTPEYIVDEQSFFEPGVPYRITLIKTGDDIHMRAVGADKKLYFSLHNDKCPEITEGRIGLRQMRSRWSRYKNFKVSVPEKSNN
jgi:hypothetical protein